VRGERGLILVDPGIAGGRGRRSPHRSAWPSPLQSVVTVQPRPHMLRLRAAARFFDQGIAGARVQTDSLFPRRACHQKQNPVTVSVASIPVAPFTNKRKRRPPERRPSDVWILPEAGAQPPASGPLSFDRRSTVGRQPHLLEYGSSCPVCDSDPSAVARNRRPPDFSLCKSAPLCPLGKRSRSRRSVLRSAENRRTSLAHDIGSSSDPGGPRLSPGLRPSRLTIGGALCFQGVKALDIVRKCLPEALVTGTHPGSGHHVPVSPFAAMRAALLAACCWPI